LLERLLNKIPETDYFVLNLNSIKDLLLN